MNRSNSIINIFLLIFLLGFIVYPCFNSLIKSFYADGQIDPFSIKLLFLDSQSQKAIINTLVIGILSCIFCWCFSLLVSYVFSRLNFKLKNLLEYLIIFPLFVPTFVSVIGIKSFFGSLIQPQNESTIVLIAFLQAIHFYPIVYLNFRSVLSNVKQGSHESIRILGGTNFHTWLNVDYLSLKPAIVSSTILMFVGSISDVGTPLLFERRDVISTKVFQALFDAPAYSSGYPLCLSILLISVISFYLVSMYEKKYPENYETRGENVKLRSQKVFSDYLLMCGAFLVIIIGLIPPFTLFILGFSKEWFLTIFPTTYSFDGFLTTISHPLVLNSIGYSTILSIFASLLCLLISFYVAWNCARNSSRFFLLLEALCISPVAIPGLVIAFGLVIGFSNTLLDSRNNPSYLLAIAYAIRKLPLVYRLCKSSILSIPKGFEESAILFGASILTLFRKIMMPVLKPAIIVGMILSFTGSLLEVSDSLLIPIEEKFFPISKTLYALQARPDGVVLSACLSIIVSIFIVVLLLLTAKKIGKNLSELLKSA